MARPKVLVEIDKFNETTGHKHTGGVGDAPPIPTSGILDGAVTDDKIGDITLDQTQVPSISTGKLRQILSWFANRLKAITGRNNWWETPTKSLEQINVDLNDRVRGSIRITVSDTPPENPNVNDIWFNTSNNQ